MKQTLPLFIALFIVWGTTACAATSPTPPPTAAPVAQSSCGQKVVGKRVIVARETADLDADGQLDEVLVYRDPGLVLVVISNAASAECKVVGTDILPFVEYAPQYTSLPTKLDTLNVADITGDGKPEIYLRTTTGGVGRDYRAYHTVERVQDGVLQRIFWVYLCSKFSSMEFRESSDGTAKEIYYTEDRGCDILPSESRVYILRQFDGVQYQLVDTGSASNFWWGLEGLGLFCWLICVSPFVILLAGLGIWVLLRLLRAPPQASVN